MAMVLRKMKGLSHCLGAPPSPSLTLGREANEEEDGEVATGTSLAHGAFAKLLTLDTEELDTRKAGTRIPRVGSIWKQRNGGTQTGRLCSYREGGYCKTDDYTPRHAEAFPGLDWRPSQYEFMRVS